MIRMRQVYKCLSNFSLPMDLVCYKCLSNFSFPMDLVRGALDHLPLNEAHHHPGTCTDVSCAGCTIQNERTACRNMCNGMVSHRCANAYAPSGDVAVWMLCHKHRSWICENFYPLYPPCLFFLFLAWWMFPSHVYLRFIKRKRERKR